MIIGQAYLMSIGQMPLMTIGQMPLMPYWSNASNVDGPIACNAYWPKCL